MAAADQHEGGQWGGKRDISQANGCITPLFPKSVGGFLKENMNQKTRAVSVVAWANFTTYHGFTTKPNASLVMRHGASPGSMLLKDFAYKYMLFLSPHTDILCMLEGTLTVVYTDPSIISTNPCV